MAWHYGPLTVLSHSVWRLRGPGDGDDLPQWHREESEVAPFGTASHRSGAFEPSTTGSQLGGSRMPGLEPEGTLLDTAFATKAELRCTAGCSPRTRVGYSSPRSAVVRVETLWVDESAIDEGKAGRVREHQDDRLRASEHRPPRHGEPRRCHDHGHEHERDITDMYRLR
jgi:hypothetical protein